MDQFLVIGESLIDIVDKNGEQSEHVGGSCLNVAVGLARLGRAAELLTWIGSDQRGEKIRARLDADGVVLADGSTGAKQTSTALATLDEKGVATYQFELDTQLPQLETEREYAAVHTGSIAAVAAPGSARVAQVMRAYSGKTLVTFDPNARPALMGKPAPTMEKMRTLIELADVVKVSDEDLQWLGDGHDIERIAKSWLKLGPKLVVITRGGDGASAYTASGLRLDVSAPKVEVVDTVGAGDSFTSGLIDALVSLGVTGKQARTRLSALTERQVREVLQRCIRIGALTVSRAGANPPYASELAH